MSRLRLLVLCALSVFIVTEAHANQENSAAAETLFQRGRDALEQRKYDPACESFRRSLELEQAPGAAMNLAVCEEARGNLARAWGRWHEALNLLGPDDPRKEYARSRLQLLEDHVPYLTIRVAKNAPNELVVERDGTVLSSASLNSPLPIDPGEHSIVVRAPSHESRTYTLYVLPGQNREVVVAAGRPDDGPKTGSVQRATGAALLGIGVGGIGTALVTGAMLQKQKKTFEQNCISECNEEGARAAERGRRLLTINTATWIAGALGVLGGSIVLLTVPKTNYVATLSISPGHATLDLGGTF